MVTRVQLFLYFQWVAFVSLFKPKETLRLLAWAQEGERAAQQREASIALHGSWQMGPDKRPARRKKPRPEPGPDGWIHRSEFHRQKVLSTGMVFDYWPTTGRCQYDGKVRYCGADPFALIVEAENGTF